MKKAMKRMTEIILSIVLLISIPSSVYADTLVHWTDNSGDHTAYADALPISDSSTTETYTISYRLQGYSSGTVVHTRGTANQMVVFSGYYSTTLKASYSTTVPYKTYVVQAMRGEGVYDSLTATVDENALGEERFLYISETSPNGTYDVGFYYSCKDGEWCVLNGVVTVWSASVESSDVSPAAVGETGSGTFSKAPTGGYWVDPFRV